MLPNHTGEDCIPNINQPAKGIRVKLYFLIPLKLRVIHSQQQLPSQTCMYPIVFSKGDSLFIFTFYWYTVLTPRCVTQTFTPQKHHSHFRVFDVYIDSSRIKEAKNTKEMISHMHIDLNLDSIWCMCIYIYICEMCVYVLFGI